MAGGAHNASLNGPTGIPAASRFGAAHGDAGALRSQVKSALCANLCGGPPDADGTFPPRKLRGRLSPALSIGAGPLHRAPQKGVDSRPIIVALSFEPGQNVLVQPDRKGFLLWPIKLTDNCLAPIEHRRNVGGVDFPLLHPLERSDFIRLSALDPLHILAFHVPLPFVPKSTGSLHR